MHIRDNFEKVFPVPEMGSQPVVKHTGEVDHAHQSLGIRRKQFGIIFVNKIALILKDDIITSTGFHNIDGVTRKDSNRKGACRMEQSRPTPLMSRLKQETQPLHARLERLPFITALADGTLPLVAYVNQLRAFAIAFGALEHETTTIQDPSIRAVSGAGESRFPHLLRDLCCFGGTMIPEIVEAKRHADAMAARMRLVGAEDPAALLGYIYVLQGTVLGNRVHLPDITRTFNIDNTNGAAFYTGYGEKTDEYWAIFTSLMNNFDSGNGLAERILAMALEAFAFMEDIHKLLYPVPASDGMSFTATCLNPEAGNHAVPADEREIVAAITAGRLCREEFPYFDARYGDRGKRFTDSDAAWLASLTSLATPLMISQVAWLGGVLASRGMPRITLERQLFHLHKELIQIDAGKRIEYDKIMEAVSWLRNERLRYITEEKFDSLGKSFAALTDNEMNGSMKGTGYLIVSAVCDEKAGIATALPSIETWLMDAGRFGKEWCAAVHGTIAQARAIMA